MRRIERRALSARALLKLREITDAVIAADDPKEKAASKWKSSTKNRAFKEIRQTLGDMAPGRSRCMYCEDSAGTDIEHFWPKSDYPERAFRWDNYLLACSYCNSNLKRNQFPLDTSSEPLLIDPSVVDPAEHMVFSPSTGRFLHRTSKGKESISVFGLNDDRTPRQLPKGRRIAFICLTELIEGYGRVLLSDPARAQGIRESVSMQPFSAVFCWLIDATQKPNGRLVLGDQLVDIIERYNVDTWLHG